MKASLLFASYRGVSVLLLGSMCLVGTRASAWAQAAPEVRSDPRNVAEADRLFKQASVHMDRREYDAACPLLERSHALDPSGGTLLNLGECYEQRGSTASAYRAFEEARKLSTRTNRTDRAQVAELRKQRLFPILRQLTIVPPSTYPETLSIYLDAKPLARSSWNVPVPVDPGEHALRARAHGYSDYSTTISAPLPGATSPVSIPALRPLASPSSADARTRTSGLDGEQVAAIACGVLGVAGVATGTVFGLQSQSKHEESDKYCTGNRCPDRRGVELMDDARVAGNLATVSFIVGGVGFGAAAVLWFARPFSSEVAAAEIGVGPAAVRVRGRW
jgi:tetratricopeptide (TPR) repeat protein